MLKRKIILVLFVIMFSVSIYSKESKILVNKIEITGIEEIPEEVVIAKLSLKKGEEFKTRQMIEDHIKLKKLSYVEDAKILPEIKNGKINLIVQLSESKDAKELLKAENIVPVSEREKVDKSLIIKGVELFGLKNAPEEEIKKLITVEEGSYFSKERIINNKTELLKTGYFKDVIPDVLKYKSGIYVKFNFVENDVLKGINIKGNTLISTEEIIKVMGTKANEIYNVITLREDTEKIRGLYHDKGYVMAEILDVRIDSKNTVLEVEISEGILRGIEYKALAERVKDEEVQTELKTKEYVLEREMELKVGEVMTLDAYQKSIRNLFKLSYFKDVKPEFKRDPSDPEGVILVLNLEENKTGSINGGISYGTEVGLILKLGIAENNFRGRAQKLALTVERSSEDEERYEISFSDPWMKGTDRLSYGVGIHKTKVVNDTKETFEEKTGLRLSFGKGLTNDIRVGITNRIEDVTIGNMMRNKEIKTEVVDGIETEYVYDDGKNRTVTDRYLIATTAPYIVYDTRNNYMDATDGNYGKYSVTLGREFGKDNYISNELDLRAYRNLLLKNNTIAGKILVGMVTPSAPKSEQFSVGGMYSLRGYNAKEFEGTREFVLNLENRYKFNDVVQLILFYDMGRAWDTLDDFVGMEDVKHSYGLGLGVNTPIGPLRFDFAWPLFDKEEKDRKFLFGVGQLF